MKDIFILIAKYNQNVNKKFFSVLNKTDSSILTDEMSSYFGNVLGLLNHVLVSDLNWFSAFRDSDLDLPSLRSPVLNFENPGWAKNLYSNLDDLKKHRFSMDNLIVDFVDETPEKTFQKVITLTHHSGEVFQFPFGKILMHLFNHQTHHRGAISQILDEKHIDNDFSNLKEFIKT